MSRCAIPKCASPTEPDAPLPLCALHLTVAHDWVERDVGVADLLPAPCAACGSPLGVRYPSGWICATCEWRVGDRPDDEPAVARVDVVYYIRFKDRVKIGTSSNPRQRLRVLWHEQLLAFERGDRLVERRRHEQFAQHRILRTEWFESHPELDAHIAELAAGVDDPWSQYARWVSRAIALRG